MSTLQHHPSGATLLGQTITVDGIPINAYRGIKYGTIPARFERAHLAPLEEFRGHTVDATRYGPRCPQVNVDVRHLLRIPEEYQLAEEEEDEFECLNLDVTVPANVSDETPLPVLVWIYGGSQAVTFCSAPSGICDPSRIVADSAAMGKPIIVVNMHYRLNIFNFGDGTGTSETNLALKDQQLAIEWVKRYISGFGGDPNNITLCGESAGAIYVHAHLIMGPPVQRAIMMSGSLALSPPLPRDFGKGMLEQLQKRAQELEGKSIRDCSKAVLKQLLNEFNLSRIWLQDEEALRDWQSRPLQARELMLGDTEFETNIWRRGIEDFSAEEITAIFDEEGGNIWGPRLRKLYHVLPSRPTAARLGAQDFVTDARFVLPIEEITEKALSQGTTVYRYLVDEKNPYQPSSRAHHAVDLLFLFGSVDLSHNPGAEAVGQEMRTRWIQFIRGEQPWTPLRESGGGKRFAFGPYGESREIDETQFSRRRRVHHARVLREAGIKVYGGIMTKLTAGRISFEN